MGLLGKGKKATWIGDSEGAYDFYLGEDIDGDSSRNSWCWNDLLVYCGTNGSHYILRDYSNKCDGNRQDAELVMESGDIVYVHDEEFSFYIFDKGIMANDTILHVQVDDDLWFYNPENGHSYVLEGSRKIEPRTFAAPRLAGTDPERGFFYRTGEYKFKFVFHGEEHSASAVAQMSDDDVILYIPAADRQFVVRGGMKMKLNSWHEDSFSNPANVPVFRKIGAASYNLFDMGKNRSGQCKAVKIGENTIVFDPEKTMNYWIENGSNLEDGAYHDATPFAPGCRVLWFRTTGGHRIYFETEDITRQAQLQRYENNAILMHEKSMSMFQLENFYSITDGIVRGI